MSTYTFMWCFSTHSSSSPFSCVEIDQLWRWGRGFYTRVVCSRVSSLTPPPSPLLMVDFRVKSRRRGREEWRRGIEMNQESLFPAVCLYVSALWLLSDQSRVCFTSHLMSGSAAAPCCAAEDNWFHIMDGFMLTLIILSRLSGGLHVKEASYREPQWRVLKPGSKLRMGSFDKNAMQFLHRILENSSKYPSLIIF